MEHEDLVGRLVEIVQEMNKMLDANQVDSENPHPRLLQLISDGNRIKKELDPLLSTIYQNNPEELAHWNTVSQAFDGLAKFGNEQAGKSDSNPIIPDGEYDPRIAKLINDADRILREEIDPLAREAYRDHPEKLAEWESIMAAYYALDKEEPDKSDS